MSKDLNEYIELIGKSLTGIIHESNVKTHQEMRYKETAEHLGKLKNALDNFQEQLRKAYEDEKKLRIPLVNEKFNQILRAFQGLDKDRQEVFRYKQMLEHNQMVPAELFDGMRPLVTSIVNTVDKILDFEEELRGLVDTEIEELAELNKDFGKRKRGEKLQKVFRKLRGAA